jgi:hypothetical protein
MKKHLPRGGAKEPMVNNPSEASMPKNQVRTVGLLSPENQIRTVGPLAANEKIGTQRGLKL